MVRGASRHVLGVDDLYLWNIHLTLESGKFIADEFGSTGETWYFTGMQWEPLAGSTASFYWDEYGSLTTAGGTWWTVDPLAPETLDANAWVKSWGATYGQVGSASQVGFTLDTGDAPYDVTVWTQAEAEADPILLSAPSASYNHRTYVDFWAYTVLPDGPPSGGVSAQLGWTGFGSTYPATGYVTLGTDPPAPPGGPTPELPPLGLLTLLPMALGGLRLRARSRQRG